MKRCYVLVMPSLAALLAAACAQQTGADADHPAVNAGKLNIVVTVGANANLSTLAELLKAAGLEETLKGPGPYTLFAPTNAAFAKMAPADLEALRKPENKAKLVKILTYQTCPKNYTTADLKGKARIASVEGDSIDVEAAGAGFKVGNDEAPMANILTPDIAAGNGTIHIIDAVFTPE